MIGLICIHWILQLVFLTPILWIAIFPVDSAIHLLKNQGQEGNLTNEMEIAYYKKLKIFSWLPQIITFTKT